MDAAVRVESRFKNAVLFNAIHEQAVPIKPDYNNMWATMGRVRAFCTMHDLNYEYVIALIGLKRKPYARFKKYVKGDERHVRIDNVALRLSQILGIPVPELFPDSLYDIEWPTVLVREVTVDQFVALRDAPRQYLLSSPSQYGEIRKRELSDSIVNALHTLRPREEAVLCKRYGLCGEREHTLDEIAQEQGVTRETIRQIESKAIRKLRHPSRSRELERHLEEHDQA